MNIEGLTLKDASSAGFGAISVDPSATLNLTQCVMSGNSAHGTVNGAALGGAISNFGHLNVRQCAFVDNSATGENGQLGSATGAGGGGGGGASGGAIHNQGFAAIFNSTFSGNLVKGGSGGAGVDNGGASNGVGGRGGNGANNGGATNGGNGASGGT